MTRVASLTAWILVLPNASARAEEPFRFEAETSLVDMQKLVRREFPVGSPRDRVRAAFVDQGGAALKVHPTRSGVEKYIYDINLCSYYVWRWNISADYGEDGSLKQLYINGEPALTDGAPQRPRPAPSPGQKASIVKVSRPRPEAYKGESRIVALIADYDGDLKTTDDEELLGGGPSRADPSNMGPMHIYNKVEPWRSIFDGDAGNGVVHYSGDCAAADAAAAKARSK